MSGTNPTEARVGARASRLWRWQGDEDAHGYVHVCVYVYVHEGRAYGPTL